MKPITPTRVIFFIVAAFAVLELGIMLLLEQMAFELQPASEALLDAMLLAILATPIIHYWVLKPYISERDSNLEQIRHMAFHDPLTNLANRRLLFAHLEKVIASSARHKTYSALILVDLDDFKPVNDTYGHDCGDALLVGIALRLQSVTRADDIVSRIGGDEFVVVLNQNTTTYENALSKATLVTEKLQAQIMLPIEFEDISINVRASMGLRIITPDKTTPDTIMKDADDAMYEAKKTEKGSISISQED